MRHSIPLFLAAVLLFGAHADAQRTPSRGDFERAVLRLASTETRSARCDTGEPSSRASVEASLRARMMGRQVVLPAVGSQPVRRAAVVLVASDVADANGTPSQRAYVVVLAQAEGTWRDSVAVEVSIEDAPYAYEESIVRIARMEDVDDDGEAELMLVLQSNTEVQCGTGYCSRSRTVVLEVAQRVAVTANVGTGLACEGETMETENATTLFRDTNADGHRDLVHRTQICPGFDFDNTGEMVQQPCGARTSTVRLWDAATDTYGVPTPIPGAW